MTWRDLLAATGAGLIAAAVALWLSSHGHVGDAHVGGAIAGVVHRLLHGATLIAALIGLLLAVVVRLDDDGDEARRLRLRALRRGRGASGAGR